MSTMRGNGRGGLGNSSEKVGELADLDVSEKQLRYLEARFAGKDKTAAADAAGVDRTTPYRWADEVDFQAARRLLRQARAAGVVHRIHKLREESLKTVTEEVENGNADLALEALRVIGLDGPSPVDPVPLDVARARAASQLQEDNEFSGMLAGG